jgi:hypothetical protein
MWETAVIAGLVGTMFLWTHLAFNLREEHSPLKLLLLMMSFLGISVTLFVTKQIAELNDAGIGAIIDVIFRGYTIIFMFVIWWFIIKFIIHVINLIRKPR